MALKISVFTTVTNPTRRGDNYQDAISCYQELADEMIVINGGKESVSKSNLNTEYKQKFYQWPQEFNWPLIGQQFQRGYELSTGDWVIHADLDFIFHENDFKSIRNAFENNPDAPALSFWKYQFIMPDRYNLKSRLVLAVNKKKYGDRIRFDSGGDLCQPSLDGKLLNTDDIPEARVPFYNYEKMTKTKEQIANDCGRMERAYQRHFGNYQMGSDGTNESAFDAYINLLKGRFNKPQEHIALHQHPKYVQETIKNLRPVQFGYNAFGMFGQNGYTHERAMG